MSVPGAGLISTTAKGEGKWRYEGDKLVFDGMMTYTSEPTTTGNKTETVSVQFKAEANGDLVVVPSEGGWDSPIRFAKD